MKRSLLLCAMVGSLVLLAGCASTAPAPVAPIKASTSDKQTKRICFAKDNAAICISRTVYDDGSTKVEMTTTPLN